MRNLTHHSLADIEWHNELLFPEYLLTNFSWRWLIDTLSIPKYLQISPQESLDIAPNILYNSLFMVYSSECLSAEVIGHASVP